MPESQNHVNAVQDQFLVGERAIKKTLTTIYTLYRKTPFSSYCNIFNGRVGRVTQSRVILSCNRCFVFKRVPVNTCTGLGENKTARVNYGCYTLYSAAHAGMLRLYKHLNFSFSPTYTKGYESESLKGFHEQNYSFLYLISYFQVGTYLVKINLPYDKKKKKKKQLIF